MRTNQLFTATITDLYGQARDANNRAVTASDKATKAQDRADKASAHEEELETRTEHEINARLTLEKLTTWEGPRFLPLRWAEGQFTSELRGFAGQHFAISVCTRDVDQTQGDMRETEIGTAWEAMEFVLHQARWELAGGRLEYLQDNCLSSRITVRAAKEATKRTCDAALSLQRVINEALGDNVAGGCDGTAYITQRIFPRPERTEPGPDVVEVHIGKHPAQPLRVRRNANFNKSSTSPAY